MREISFDTETTGLNPRGGDRLVEIGGVELINHIPTGNVYHVYINPERDMPEEAFRVHGLSEEFLGGYPVFREIADAFVDFIGDSPMVIHNAGFDMKFINAELEWLKKSVYPMSRAVDTLMMARQRFPGAQVSLDALCRRFEIDNSSRTFHGALLDSELLAEVYLELTGGRQPGFELAGNGAQGGVGGMAARKERPFREPRPHAPSEAELAAHREFMTQIKDPIWDRTGDEG